MLRDTQTRQSTSTSYLSRSVGSSEVPQRVRYIMLSSHWAGIEPQWVDYSVFSIYLSHAPRTVGGCPATQSSSHLGIV